MELNSSSRSSSTWLSPSPKSSCPRPNPKPVLNPSPIGTGDDTKIPGGQLDQVDSEVKDMG